VTIFTSGEDALLVEFSNEISPEVSAQVRRLAFALELADLPEAVEIVPAYRSLMVYFDPSSTTPERLGERIREIAGNASGIELPPRRVFRIPAVYGGEFGPDLDEIAAHAGVPPDGVIRAFSSARYPVYCLGFLCCLAYLGGIPEPLRMPRLATPRTRLPAGSIGVAGGQAVILPIDQPSGFRYLGRTFVTMYDPAAFPPVPVRPGDLFECPAVSETEARKWEGRHLGECEIGSTSGS
jgi:KipI family sensor histidine kinase inhibitor